jgi:hypothetical protein
MEGISSSEVSPYIIKQKMKENNSSTPIYRYMDLPELFSILINEKLFFCRSDCFPDNNECNLTKDDKARFKYEYEQSLTPAERNLDGIFKKFETDLESERNNIFISSWSIKRDDYALWKIYTDNSKFGVCIETSINDINNLIERNLRYFMKGKAVDYTDRQFHNLIKSISCGDDKRTVDEIIDLLVFHKSKHYEYEDEYRVVAFDKNISAHQGISFSINISSFIKAIHLSPFMPEWFINILMQLGGMSITGDQIIDRKKLEIFRPLLEIRFSKIEDKQKTY